MDTINNKTPVIYNLLAFTLLVFMAYMLQDFLIPILFAILLSVLIYPIVKFFETDFASTELFP